jgi:hypothetical protein
MHTVGASAQAMSQLEAPPHSTTMSPQASVPWTHEIVQANPSGHCTVLLSQASPPSHTSAQAKSGGHVIMRSLHTAVS